MGKPLRVLVVEDVERDAELVLRELKRGGYDLTHERVDTAETMAAALRSKLWDVVISDYSMPHFSALMALQVVKESKLDLPFIIVSGTVSEDTAVEAIRAGAHDFMPKGKFARLIPAIERERGDAAVRAERTKMQEQLLISDRMASMGTVAAGVAHEINNPLAATMVNIDLAIGDVTTLGEELRARKPGESDEALWGAIAVRVAALVEPLRDARESADRVRHIVRDLKLFSRSDEEQTGPVDIHRVLDSALRMAGNDIRHRAQLVKDYRAVSNVEGNDARLGQVFLNLIVNAAQAIPEGAADHNEIRILTKTDDQHVVIEIRDTGAGMPEAVRARIFDPFFTTKPIGIGTGLGLAICHRIVTAMGGQIAVESQVGEGTVFRTLLPVAKSDPISPVPPTAAAVSGRRGRVLVVDDEALLGSAIRRILTAEHDVLVLTNAREAIQRIVAGEHFDVILCDLMMPEVTGMDVHAELARAAPDQAKKMVFMTGGAFTSRAREFLDRCLNPRLEKPFEHHALRAIVRSMVT